MRLYQQFTVAQQAFEYCLCNLNVHDPLTTWAAMRADILYKKLLASRERWY